jgi:hypothetical protein
VVRERIGVLKPEYLWLVEGVGLDDDPLDESISPRIFRAKSVLTNFLFPRIAFKSSLILESLSSRKIRGFKIADKIRIAILKI